MTKQEALLEMVRGIREGFKRSPGLSSAPFSDEGWAIIEEALAQRAEVVATEKGLTPTGQYIADCEKDTARWRFFVKHYNDWWDGRTVLNAIGELGSGGPDEVIDAAMKVVAERSPMNNGEGGK